MSGLIIPSGVSAQTIDATVAGPTRPQSGLAQPPVPLSVPQTAVQLLDEQTAPAQAADVTFTFNRLRIEGATAISVEALLNAWPHQVGADIPVSELFSFANEVTRIYSDAGYALSFGVVPEQRIENGVVTIRVVEGFVESIAFVGDKADELAGSAVMLKADEIAQRILGSRPLRTADLERYVLLVNDLPGLEVSTTLAAAPETTGGSTLSIAVREHHRVEAQAGYNSFLPDSLDNHAVEGWVRANGALTGTDQIRIGAQRSIASDAYWSVSGDASIGLGTEGLKVGATWFYSESDPDSAFLSSLEYLGETRYASFFATYPVLRSRSRNLIVGASASLSDSESEILAAPLTVDRLRTLEAFAAFDFADRTQAINYVRLGIEGGFDVFGATGNSRANGDVEYAAVTLDAQTDRPLFNVGSGTVAARLMLHGQTVVGSNAVFSAAECTFGGRSFGRGFEPSTLSGDHCLLGAAELRWTRHFDSELTLDFYGFADGGVTAQKGTLEQGELRRRTAASAGLGVRMEFNDHVSGMVEAAFPIKDPSGASGAVDDFRFGTSLRVRF